jgi:hypothetical protein
MQGSSEDSESSDAAEDLGTSLLDRFCHPQLRPPVQRVAQHAAEEQKTRNSTILSLEAVAGARALALSATTLAMQSGHHGSPCTPGAVLRLAMHKLDPTYREIEEKAAMFGRFRPRARPYCVSPAAQPFGGRVYVVCEGGGAYSRRTALFCWLNSPERPCVFPPDVLTFQGHVLARTHSPSHVRVSHRGCLGV